MPHLSPPDGHSSFPAENVRVEAEEVGCYIEAAVDLIFMADAKNNHLQGPKIKAAICKYQDVFLESTGVVDNQSLSGREAGEVSTQIVTTRSD